ncbi:hypothetical protein [Roseovarius sp. 2305UL8-3]|uniref:hypothetical protein n=1 Tax=Roseovarius conchicola TaxID=3121636 RepID=UPI0035279A7F
MAQAALKPVPVEAPKTPDWVDAYYSPEPANFPRKPSPELSALEQMYAYYDA